MGTLKKFDNITKAQIASNGVQALADRPNSTGSYGVGGLSPADLKKWFDRLAELLAERINTIQNTISSDDAAKYIRVALDDSDVDSLSALIEGFASGAFASKILKVYPSVSADELVTLQQAIYQLVTRAELEELVSELEAVLRESSDAVSKNAEIFKILEERLKSDDIGSDVLKWHNENTDAHANLFGEDNKKGIKGYWIEAYSTQYNVLVFSQETDRAKVGKPKLYSYAPPSTTNTPLPYDVGDEFCVITPKDHYMLCGKITIKSGNRISYEKLQEFNLDAGDPTDNNDYAFFVPSKPTEGIVTVCEGSVAEGYETRAGGDWSHSEGALTNAIGSYSHAEGLRTWAGYSGHAEGSDTKAVGKYAHAEGFSTTAKGGSSHAEGENTEASGFVSHAEGKGTKAIGTRTHSEGENTTASGDYSHSEGEGTVASGGTSHAEGCGTEASGVFSHSEGLGTKAAAICSHSQGRSTEASGDYTFASGVGTKATQYAETAIGSYNKPIENALLSVGNGADESDRTNAFNIVSRGSGSSAVVSMVLGASEMTDFEFGSLSNVMGYFAGTSTAVLHFDRKPLMIFYYKVSDSSPKVQLVNVAEEDDGVYSIHISGLTNFEKYAYLAIFNGMSNDNTSFEFWIRNTGSNTYRHTYTANHGTTWNEFVENKSFYYVGVSTGRVYHMNQSYYESSSGNEYRYTSAYLKDSNGDYVLGTDMITAQEYVQPVASGGTTSMQDAKLD